MSVIHQSNRLDTVVYAIFIRRARRFAESDNFEMCGNGKRTGALLVGRFGPNRDTHSLAVVCRG